MSVSQKNKQMQIDQPGLPNRKPYVAPRREKLVIVQDVTRRIFKFSAKLHKLDIIKRKGTEGT